MTISKRTLSWLLPGLTGAYAGLTASLIGYDFWEYQYWMIILAGLFAFFMGHICQRSH